MTFLDKIIAGVTDSIRKSGMLESTTLMATVSAVGADGTITATRGDDTFPKVRILSGYWSPAVGDTVEISKTVGGWVCLGKLQTTRPVPRVQSGQGSVPGGQPSSGGWSTATVTFPVAFTNIPNVTVTPLYSATTSTTRIIPAVYDVTTSSFTLKVWRDGGTGGSTCSWIATDF
ncbi:H-type lectin domain-containing protein [Streptomyces malaysiensis]